MHWHADVKSHARVTKAGPSGYVTFLISIFVPRLLAEFTLNTAQFGVLYAGATLTSAASLPFFGRVLDRVTLRAFSLAVGLGLATACFAMAFAPNVMVLFLAILGLRLTGQGLLSLTASTTMATALWAEVYGVETLGATKSTVSMLGIFGTALGPLLLGGLLKAGVSFQVIIPTCAILGLLAVGISFLARSSLRAASAASMRVVTPRAET